MFYTEQDTGLIRHYQNTRLPTEHQGVHKNSFKNVRAFQIELEWKVEKWKVEMLFLRRGENRSTRSTRSTSRSRVENQQQTQPTYDAGSRNRTRVTLMEGERSHHCTIPAPRIFLPY